MLQVLRDVDLREAYNRQLDQRRMLGHIAPSDTIGKEDLEHLAKDGVMKYGCRCGGSYIIDPAEVQLYTESLLPCDTCSQYVCLDTSHDKPAEMPNDNMK